MPRDRHARHQRVMQLTRANSGARFGGAFFWEHRMAGSLGELIPGS